MKSFIVILVVIAVLIGFISLFVAGEHRRDANDHACRARGGVPFRSRDSGFICIKSEAVIDP